jgi:nudix-type nucleoside diphosphatase (YffH/AdpP family)
MDGIESRIRIEETRILSDNHYVLRKVTFSWLRTDGTWQRASREVYDRGNGCAILLFDPARRTVVLTRQFRLPAYMNGYRGLLIEAAAGLLGKADPETRIKKEAEEETGYRPKNLRKVLECFTSPGAVTETLTLFVGEYDSASRPGTGGGLKDEGEDIEVLELPFADAMAMVDDGRIRDAKTIILLQYAQLHIFRA